MALGRRPNQRFTSDDVKGVPDSTSEMSAGYARKTFSSNLQGIRYLGQFELRIPIKATPMKVATRIVRMIFGNFAKAAVNGIGSPQHRGNAQFP